MSDPIKSELEDCFGRILAYDKKNKLFFLEGRFIGCGFRLSPMAVIDEMGIQRINKMMSAKWPSETTMRVSSYSGESGTDKSVLVATVKMPTADLGPTAYEIAKAASLQAMMKTNLGEIGLHPRDL